MLKVFICEDNIKQKDRFIKIINNIILIENYDMEIELATHDPYEVINNIKENTTSAIYFLDVDLSSDINGIQLAECIRKYDPRGFIVFITSHAEMSYLTFLYKVEAMDYIIKDNYENIAIRIKECIENAHTRYLTKTTDLQKIFSIKVNDKIISVNYENILFFETSSTIHKIIMHCENRQIEFYSQMSSLIKSLDDRFCRCHTSYIVNKNKISEIDKKNRKVYMVNGEECLASIRGIKNLFE